MELILLTHIAATFAMVGIIWFVQVVHYPLYTRINPDAFPNYEVAHINLVTLVVVPFMFLEAFTALLLLFNPPPNVSIWLVLVGLGLVGVIWATTLFFNVAQHNALSVRYDHDVHQALLAANWVRTVAWSLRGLLVLWILARVIQ
ncbi:MAG: hypothetical protein ACOYL5_19870 [Phototrophicaceae bacterium]|jgi:hypothetical protein